MREKEKLKQKMTGVGRRANKCKKVGEKSIFSGKKNKRNKLKR